MSDITEIPVEDGVIPMVEFTDHGAEPKSPFVDESTEFALSKAVDLNLLRDEIEAEVGHPVQMVVQHTPEGFADILYVTPVIDSAALNKVVTDHAMPAGDLDPALVEAVNKARAGQTLSGTEVAAVLSLLLGNIALPHQP